MQHFLYFSHCHKGRGHFSLFCSSQSSPLPLKIFWILNPLQSNFTRITLVIPCSFHNNILYLLMIIIRAEFCYSSTTEDDRFFSRFSLVIFIYSMFQHVNILSTISQIIICFTCSLHSAIWQSINL